MIYEFVREGLGIGIDVDIHNKEVFSKDFKIIRNRKYALRNRQSIAQFFYHFLVYSYTDCTIILWISLIV